MIISNMATMENKTISCPGCKNENAILDNMGQQIDLKLFCYDCLTNAIVEIGQAKERERLKLEILGPKGQTAKELSARLTGLRRLPQHRVAFNHPVMRHAFSEGVPNDTATVKRVLSDLLTIRITQIEIILEVKNNG